MMPRKRKAPAGKAGAENKLRRNSDPTEAPPQAEPVSLAFASEYSGPYTPKDVDPASMFTKPRTAGPSHFTVRTVADGKVRQTGLLLAWKHGTRYEDACAAVQATAFEAHVWTGQHHRDPALTEQVIDKREFEWWRRSNPQLHMGEYFTHLAPAVRASIELIGEVESEVLEAPAGPGDGLDRADALLDKYCDADGKLLDKYCDADDELPLKPVIDLAFRHQPMDEVYAFLPFVRPIEFMLPALRVWNDAQHRFAASIADGRVIGPKLPTPRRSPGYASRVFSGLRANPMQWKARTQPEPEPAEAEAPAVKRNLGEIDHELVRAAPGILGVLITHYLKTQASPEPVYALVSALASVAGLVGARYRTPSGAAMNLQALVIGPTSSGKQSMLKEALEVVKLHWVSLAGSEHPGFMEQIASAEGLWWRLAEQHEAFVFDPEVHNLLAAAAKHSERYGFIVRALRMIFDAVDQTVAPPAYSKRTSSGVKEMPSLVKPFLPVIGTTTRQMLRDHLGTLASDGTLNRFLILNCDGTSPGQRPTYGTLPCLKDWMTRARKGRQRMLKCDANDPRLLSARVTVPFGDGVEDAHDAFRGEVKALADDHPGTWPRTDLRVFQLALMAAVADKPEAPVIELKYYEWARAIARQAAELATAAMQREGGAFEDKGEALESAIMQCFDAPKVRETCVMDRRVTISKKIIAQYGGRAWGKVKDPKLRENALQTLVDDGFIEKVDTPRGAGYVRVRRYSRHG